MANEIVQAPTSAMVNHDQFNAMREQANTLIRSGFLPKAIDTPEKAIAIMMAGRELGIEPMRSIRELHVIDGKVGISAKLMSSLVYERLPTATLKITETNDASCTVIAGRPGDDKPASFTFTIDDAKRAGLLEKDVWKKWTRDMLRNRAISEACRAVFPDVVGGAYTPEELEPLQAAPIDYDDPAPFLDRLAKAETKKALNEAASEANKAAVAGRISPADRQAMLEIYNQRKAQVA